MKTPEEKEAFKKRMAEAKARKAAAPASSAPRESTVVVESAKPARSKPQPKKPAASTAHREPPERDIGGDDDWLL